MFGLMKASVCSRHSGEPNRHRLHYCGTCKTMGRLYGQKSRLLLNHDAVFLSELLSDLSPDGLPLEARDAAYASYNCFALPESPESMPIPLQIAASVTLLLTEFKLADQIEDSAKGRWRLAQKLYSPGFYKAAEFLQGQGFPVAALRDWRESQAKREAAARSGEFCGSPREILAFVAEPTAIMTGLTFQHSAATLDYGAEIQRTMYELGRAFGELIYVLDACDDYEKDARRGDFNAIRMAFGASPETETPNAEIREQSPAILQTIAARIERELFALPLPAGRAEMYAARLKRNLSRRLGLDSETETACAIHAPAPKTTFRERRNATLAIAQRLTAKQRDSQSGFAAQLAAPFHFAEAFAIALIFPRPAQSANSLQECRDIARNLIFIGEAVNAAARKFAFASALPTGANLARTMSGELTHSESKRPNQEIVVVKRRRPGWGCCDGCADTFDCCNCACCACDGLECCAGCCDGAACCS